MSAVKAMQLTHSACESHSHSTLLPLTPKEKNCTKIALQKLSEHYKQLDLLSAYTALSIGRKYTLRKIVGTGTFGVAILATSLDHQEVVIKVSRERRYNDHFIQEYRSLQTANVLSPDHTVQALDCIQDLNLSDCGSEDRCCSDRVALITAYGGPTIATYYIQDPTLPISANDFISFVRQSLQFWAGLSKEDYVLRDIKPDNIVIDGEGRCRFLDFGFFGEQGEEAYFYQTTRYYRSPTLLKQRLDPSEMPFALACVFFEALTGYHLFYTEISPLLAKDSSHYTQNMTSHFSKVFALLGMPTEEWSAYLEQSMQQLCSDAKQKSKQMHPDREARIRNFQRRIQTAIDPHNDLRRINAPEMVVEAFYQHFIDLLFHLLNYEHPSTAKQMLEHPFLTLNV